MENFRLFKRAIFAGLGFLGIAGITSPAHAYLDFANLGPLSGPSAVDGQTAAIGASFIQEPTSLGQSLNVTAYATETFDGKPVTFPGYGGGSLNIFYDPGYDDNQYEAGYIFTLGVPSSVVFTPATTGLNFVLYKDEPVPEISSQYFEFPLGKVPNTSPGTLYFADLPAGLYTLDFTGTLNLQLDQTSSLSFGTVSAVPLPGSLTMFGTALIGLIGLGTQKQRGSRYK